MGSKTLEGLFDIQRFIHDVNLYMERQNMSKLDLFCLMGYGSDPKKLAPYLTGSRKSIPFHLVILMANECDLSLDSYRI